jgi:hypothetical protein
MIWTLNQIDMVIEVVMCSVFTRLRWVPRIKSSKTKKEEGTNFIFSLDLGISVIVEQSWQSNGVGVCVCVCGGG